MVVAKKTIGCGVLNIGCGSENQKIQNIHSMTNVSFHLLLLDIITEPNKGTLEEGGSANSSVLRLSGLR